MAFLFYFFTTTGSTLSGGTLSGGTLSGGTLAGLGGEGGNAGGEAELRTEDFWFFPKAL